MCEPSHQTTCNEEIKEMNGKRWNGEIRARGEGRGTQEDQARVSESRRQGKNDK